MLFPKIVLLATAMVMFSGTIQSAPDPQTTPLPAGIDRATFHLVKPELSPEELAAQVDQWAAEGVGAVVIGGGNHHYLFNSVGTPELEAYMNAAKILTERCNAKGISVIEHHSNCLLSPNLSEKYEPMLQRGFSPEGKSIVVLQDLYSTRVFCPNNKDFRDLYWSILSGMLDEGKFNGVMSDDANLYGGCSCDVCTEKFKAEFEGDIGNAFVAAQKTGSTEWRKWHAIRRQWMTDFYDDFHARLAAERPGIFTFLLANDPLSAWPSQTTGLYAELYALYGDVILWEIYNPSDFASYRPIATSASYYRALCELPTVRVEKVLMMPFADQADKRDVTDPAEELFMWALAKTVNLDFCLARVFLTGMVTGDPERFFFNYEKNHPEWFDYGNTHSNIGILFSAASRDIDPAWESTHLPAFQGWAQSLKNHGLEYRAISELNLSNEAQKAQKLPAVLIVPNAFALSDHAIAQLTEYVSQGGTLVIHGLFGTVDETGVLRNPDNPQLNSLLGGKLSQQEPTASPISGALPFVAEQAEPYPQSPFGNTFCNHLGSGTVLVIPEIPDAAVAQKYMANGSEFHHNGNPASAEKMAQLAKILSPHAVELKTADGKLPFFGIYNSKDEDNVIFIPIVNTSGSDELAEGTPIPIPSKVSWPASKPLTLTMPQAIVKAEMLNYPDDAVTELDVMGNAVQIPMPEKFGVLKITF